MFVLIWWKNFQLKNLVFFPKQKLFRNKGQYLSQQSQNSRHPINRQLTRRWIQVLIRSTSMCGEFVWTRKCRICCVFIGQLFILSDLFYPWLRWWYHTRNFFNAWGTRNNGSKDRRVNGTRHTYSFKRKSGKDIRRHTSGIFSNWCLIDGALDREIFIFEIFHKFKVLAIIIAMHKSNTQLFERPLFIR